MVLSTLEAGAGGLEGWVDGPGSSIVGWGN